MRNGTRRVAVTGVGCVTPIGTGVIELWEGLRAGHSAVRALTRFDPTDWKSKIAAEIPDFRAADHLDAKRAKRFDRYSALSVASAQLAVADAELDLHREDLDRVGVMMGSALGGIAFAEQQAALYVEGGRRAVNPALALAVFGGAGSCNIAIALGPRGPNSTNAMSCASGTIAIGDAFRAIRTGEADVMLAGGAEAPLSPLAYGCFSIIRAMSTRNDDPQRASRPFDRDRDGFVMGEGAAVLVLEELSRARSRGAQVYGEIVGYGLTNDAHHMTAPLPSATQAARAMRIALHDADVAPHGVGYVNAHGSATPLNDPTETDALKQVFGERCKLHIVRRTARTPFVDRAGIWMNAAR